MEEQQPPQEMQAAQVASFGMPSVITLSKIPVPAPPSKDQLVIKVEAVSLSPSDYRILTGACSLMKKPPKGKFPYTPGGDISGTVYKTHQTESDYKVGEKVFATWYVLGFGGLAEYALVEKKLVERIPDDVGFLEAAAMANSPVNALLAVEDARIGPGDRVLVLGGSGGVGTGVIQLARFAGASFIAATSTDTHLVLSLGADVAIDYTKEKWYENQEFRTEKFDVIIDMAEGESAWSNSAHVLKPSKQGGRFIAGVWNDWHIGIQSIVSFISFMSKPMWRTLKTRFASQLPKYTVLFPAPRGDSMARFLEKREQGFKVVLDPRCPWEFSESGVRDAFEVMIARKGHGKVVIAVAEGRTEHR